MAFDFSTLVTDRSPEDLQALRDLLATPMADWTAEQLAEFNRAVSKGSYNYTDLNRVIAAMDDINERLTAAGYVTVYHPIIVHPETPPPTPTLPEGYTELEYIESSGTQYIDTGFHPTQSTRIIMDVQMTTLNPDGHEWFFGARRTGSVAAFGFFWNYSAQKFGATYGNKQVDISSAVGKNERIIIDQNRNQLTFNGQSYTFPVATFQTPVNLPLLARNTNGTLAAYISAKVWSAQLFDDGQLIRDYVPCKNPSNEVGLYDLVDGEFYPNAGAGVFSAGPEVINPQPDPELDPYSWYENDVPTQSQLTRYLDNVSKLRNVLTLPENTIDAPEDMEGLTLQEANGIETILEIINTYLVAIESIILSAGMSWAISGGPNFYFAI